MPKFVLSCPHCGGAIAHSCGANLGAITAQTVAQSSLDIGANAEIAHVSKTSSVERSKKYNQGYDQHFLVFWAEYPLKRDKRKAANAWRNAVARLAANPGANATAAMAQIVAGAIRYRDDPNRVDQFTKYAEGWLNGDGWEDEPLPPRSGNGQRTARNVNNLLDRAARLEASGR